MTSLSQLPPSPLLSIPVFALGLVLSWPAPIAAQTQFCRYNHGTLTQVLDSARPMADSLGGVIATSQYPTRAQVTFTGEERPLTELHARMFETYGSMNHQSLRPLYHLELRFQEGDRFYWLPVQDNMAQAIKSEVNAGDSLMVFVVLIGGDVRPDTTDWLVAMTEFQSRDTRWQWFRRVCGP